MTHAPSLAAGSQQVLDDLLSTLRHHYSELVAHVRRHTGRNGGDQAWASDIVHEVCIELLAAPPQNPIHAPLAFLREVSRRRAIDHLRSETRRAQWIEYSDVPPDAEDCGSYGKNPELRHALQQTLLRLVAAIEALPLRCREVFILCKIHEYSQLEAAEHLAISIKTVEKHLQRGVESCRRVLEGEW